MSESPSSPEQTLPSTQLEPSVVLGPFRRTMLRGLAVFLPPLLTVVILVWVWQTLKSYVLEPITQATNQVLTWSITEIIDTPPVDAEFDPQNPQIWNNPQGTFYRLESGQSIPLDVAEHVHREYPQQRLPNSAQDYFRLYTSSKYLQSWFLDPIILGLFLFVMYVIGNLFAADAARVMWSLFEYLMQKVPLIRSIYIPVRQVVNYLFDTEQPRFSRVVAVEYPRRGIWTLAFVTGEGMADVEKITGEPMLTILFPTSPVPVTGNTKIVPRREVIDLPVTIEQAAQYIVSFGVVINEDAVKSGQLPAPQTTENGIASQTNT
jgi:uncharacterized membrane protein